MRRNGLAGFVAGCAAVFTVAAFAPATAFAHPCTSKFPVATASFLSLNNAGWGGGLPTLGGDDDCADRGLHVRVGATSPIARSARW